MPSPTIAYRFPDEATGLAAIEALPQPHSIALDIIGHATRSGTYDAEGNELTPPEPLVGWHVNTSAPVEGWEEYQVHPTNWLRKFA